MISNRLESSWWSAGTSTAASCTGEGDGLNIHGQLIGRHGRNLEWIILDRNWTQHRLNTRWSILESRDAQQIGQLLEYMILVIPVLNFCDKVWNGSAWTEVNDTSTARFNYGGAGADQSSRFCSRRIHQLLQVYGSIQKNGLSHLQRQLHLTEGDYIFIWRHNVKRFWKSGWNTSSDLG